MSTDEKQEAVRDGEVRIRIHATQIIYLDKEVTCRKEDYDRLMSVYESGDERRISDEIEGIFDERDVANWEPYEDVEIGLIKAASNG